MMKYLTLLITLFLFSCDGKPCQKHNHSWITGTVISKFCEPAYISSGHNKWGLLVLGVRGEDGQEYGLSIKQSMSFLDFMDSFHYLAATINVGSTIRFIYTGVGHNNMITIYHDSQISIVNSQPEIPVESK